MLTIEFDVDKGGWQEPQIGLFDNLTIHPAAKALQYASQVNNRALVANLSMLPTRAVYKYIPVPIRCIVDFRRNESV